MDMALPPVRTGSTLSGLRSKLVEQTCLLIRRLILAGWWSMQDTTREAVKFVLVCCVVVSRSPLHEVKNERFFGAFCRISWARPRCADRPYVGVLRGQR